MKTIYFSRALLLWLFLISAKNYGSVTSHQTQKQMQAFNKNASELRRHDSYQKKCSRNGCLEGIEQNTEYPLFIFISFSMPEETLISLSNELNTYGGAFVVRGLPGNSFAEFFDKLNYLKVRGMEAPLLIDPDSFENYQISAVPTILLKDGKIFDKITGNVPVLFALESFASKGETGSFARSLLATSNQQGTNSTRKIQ